MTATVRKPPALIHPAAPIYAGVIELAGDEFKTIPHLERYPAADLTILLHGCPIGRVTVPIVNGELSRDHTLALVLASLGEAIGREWVRRCLRSQGVPGVFHAGQVFRPLPPGPVSALKVTVAVCTRDRTDDLRRCLAAVQRLDPPPFEVVVVDNAPRTEETRRLLHEEFPGFRYVREERPGLNNARNRAILEARGEILAYTDDDVVVDRRWVGAISQAFAGEPDIGAVTGLVVPLQLEHEGQLLFERVGGFQKGFIRRRACIGSKRVLPWQWLGTGQFGTGANMAFRRSIFAQTGWFDPCLDVGTPTNGGGDLEIYMRVLKAGWTLLYDPAVLVRHRHRRTRKELERQLADFGIGFRCYLERVARNFPEERAGLARMKRWWWRHWAGKRWLGASFRPSSVPRDLVVLEIKGFLQARGRYGAARRALIPDERTAPDTLASRVPDPPLRASGSKLLVSVDASVALRDLPESAGYAETLVAVRWRDQACGEVRLKNDGRAISVAELADTIAEKLSGALISPALQLPTALIQANTLAAMFSALHVVAPPRPRLDHSVPVSIVIATRDRPADLRRCLLSLRETVTARPLQIVVVDNHPDSALTAAVLLDFPEVTAVQEPRPGLSYARNAGIAASFGEIVVTTDDDAVVPPDWLENLVAPFARADIAAVTGNVLPASLATEAERQFESYGGLGRGQVRRTFDFDWLESFRRKAVPTWSIGATANAAFRSGLFFHPQIGMLHEALGAGSPTGCSEDTLLFYQILAQRGTILYEPAAYVWHHHRTTGRALRDQIYSYSKGHVAYHLMTFGLFRDWRGLFRVGVELPRVVLWRAWLRLRRHSIYPASLLAFEALGYLAGPWALWASVRRARRLGPGARLAPARPSPGLVDSPVPAETAAAQP
jgi:GT2 family glycosyltransferase